MIWNYNHQSKKYSLIESFKAIDKKVGTALPICRFLEPLEP
jgi:hypothetical protein